MNEWNDPNYWGLLNAGIAFNTGVIAARLFLRAARDPGYSGARILYGIMFLAASIFFGILAVSQWRFADGRPDAGFVGLALLWVATTIAVIYLVIWGRQPQQVNGDE